jgi:hypothetical protein
MDKNGEIDLEFNKKKKMIDIIIMKIKRRILIKKVLI